MAVIVAPSPAPVIFSIDRVLLWNESKFAKILSYLCLFDLRHHFSCFFLSLGRIVKSNDDDNIVNVGRTFHIGVVGKLKAVIVKTTEPNFHLFCHRDSQCSLFCQFKFENGRPFLHNKSRHIVFCIDHGPTFV